MPDFSWTAQHDELPMRHTILPLLEQAGYQQISDSRALERNSRPRTILATADQRARVELIGPEDVIFKATLLLARTPETAADLRGFLATLVPGWQDAAEWIETALADQAPPPDRSIRFRDLEITLRSANQQRLALGITWQP